MTTAILIEDGVVQLVLTPESKFEQQALQTLNDKKINVKLFHGEYYDCQGGWKRQKSFSPMCGVPYDGNDSLIIRVEDPEVCRE